MAAPPKRKGRPRIDDADSSVLVGLTLPSKVYDRYAALAVARQSSVPEVLRKALRRSDARSAPRRPPSSE